MAALPVDSLNTISCGLLYLSMLSDSKYFVLKRRIQYTLGQQQEVYQSLPCSSLCFQLIIFHLELHILLSYPLSLFQFTVDSMLFLVELCQIRVSLSVLIKCIWHVDVLLFKLLDDLGLFYMDMNNLACWEEVYAPIHTLTFALIVQLSHKLCIEFFVIHWLIFSKELFKMLFVFLVWLFMMLVLFIFISSLSPSSLTIYYLRFVSSNRVQFVASAFHIASDPPLVSVDLELLHIVVGCWWADRSIGHFHILNLEWCVVACSMKIKCQ